VCQNRRNKGFRRASIGEMGVETVIGVADSDMNSLKCERCRRFYGLVQGCENG